MKLSLKTRRILTLILLPLVILGLYYIYKHNRVNEIYAVDPLVVTMDGNDDDTLDTLFDLADMKPGDDVTHCFKIENTTEDSVSIEMSLYKTLEEKAFSEILEIEVTDSDSSSSLFQGTLKDLFDTSPLSLGNLYPDPDRNFCVRVYFPKEADNDYQEAKVVFNIVWRTQLPLDDIPPECEHLRGRFESVIYGTEGNDNLHGNRYSNLIYALGGDDVVDASSSDDCVVLGDGDDYVESESGDDIVLGGNGNDTILSGTGNDRVWGGAGDDDIDSGSDADNVWGGDGNDKIFAGSGDDNVWGGNGNDDIDLGSGYDFGYGEDGLDNILGSSDDDFLDGGNDYDELTGESGTDTCVNGEKLDSCEL